MDITVKGQVIDDNTRCKHYHSELDIIAIKFKCCNTYYACIDCHNENESHEVKLWQKNERATSAILCGHCKVELSIADYFEANNECPVCKSLFNPRCSNHYHFYFEL